MSSIKYLNIERTLTVLSGFVSIYSTGISETEYFFLSINSKLLRCPIGDLNKTFS